MTYNPSRYEYPYGIHLLDDLHNLFPELLYDPGMFPGNQLLTFMQMRTNELFPADYAHNRTQYRLYQLERRRREAGIPLPSLHQTPQRRRVTPIPVPATPARPTRPVSRQVPHPEPQPQPQVHTQYQTYTIPLTNLFSTLLGSAATGPTGATDEEEEGHVGMQAMQWNPITVTTTPTTTTNLLNTLMVSALLGQPSQDLTDLLTPVVVAPTAAQLAAGTIVSSLEPPADVTCTICQDHAPPVPTATEWRILRHCGHRFHRTCIDQWFRQNVHCPVCRHDIREVNTETAN